MADRTIANPERGCGTLKRGKAYVRGVIGSPDGVLPSFVRLDPPVPYREVGTDGGMTRGFLKFDGTTAQFTLDDITDFIRLYPGDVTDEQAVRNMVEQGLYDALLGVDDDDDPITNSPEVPDFEGQRHVDRVRAMGADGQHFGEISACQASDLLMRAGKTHYPDPDDFIEEAVELGISKAIPMSQNQAPPVIAPGATRCWIVHPNTDVGFGVIGYAHLQEVVFTEPADGHVPQYVQDFEASGRLEVVDIEPADTSGPNARVDDYLDEQDQEDADEAADVDADPGGQDPKTVVPAEGTTDQDVQDVRAALDAADDIGYNEQKRIASSLDLDVGQHPGGEDLLDALEAEGITPEDARGILDSIDGGDGDD